MRYIALCLAILTALLGLVRAEDITLSDGTTYKDATVLRHDAVTATILYTDGGAAIPIARLPPDLQKRLNYDPAAAQKQLASDAVASAQAEVLAAKTRLLDGAALKIWGEIEQVRENGFVADVRTVDKCAPALPVTQTTPVHTLPVGFGPPDVVQTTVVGYRRAKISLGQVYVEGNITGLIDHAHWRGFVWPVGTYSYVTDKGRHVTIAAYTTFADHA